MNASSWLSLPGAVAAEQFDPQIAAHYGSPLAEQRRLAEGQAIVDFSHFAVLSVTGDDRLSWLDSLVSQSLTGLHTGGSAETLILDPNGRVQHAFAVLDDGTTSWLLTERSRAEQLLSWLLKMRFRFALDIEDRSDAYTVVGAFTDLAPLAAAPHGVALAWRDPWQQLQPGGWSYATEAEHPSADWNWQLAVVSAEDFRTLPARAELEPAGYLAYQALRIAAWRPELSSEGDERLIPHEVDWLRSAVHLSKGCYRGQETVAKVHNLGHPPRRLAFLHLDGSQSVLPERGAEVWVPGVERAAGLITSAALHWELGPIALAMLKRRTPSDAELQVHTADAVLSATQQEIVSPDAGATAGVPRLNRPRPERA